IWNLPVVLNQSHAADSAAWLFHRLIIDLLRPGRQRTSDRRHQTHDFLGAGIVDLVRRITRSVIIAMRAGEGVENRHALQVESRGVSREIAILLSGDRESERNVGTLYCARPD